VTPQQLLDFFDDVDTGAYQEAADVLAAALRAMHMGDFTAAGVVMRQGHPEASARLAVIYLHTLLCEVGGASFTDALAGIVLTSSRVARGDA
jgi:hypothetical protein